MKKPVVIIGIGEMAGVFARGFLRSGHPVYPVTRHMDIATEAKALDEPALVLLAVAEDDLHPMLDSIPEAWRDRLMVLQNELLPRDWLQHQIPNPTLISVWFEKKKGQDFKVIIPSPVFGPYANLVHDALQSIGIACKVLDNEDELLFELVRKNVYILTANIAGLVTGGTVSELWQQHQTLAREVANEIIEIQEYLTGTTLDHDRLINGMVEAFDGDPAHGCTGRSAPKRLARVLEHAQQAGLTTTKLLEIQKQQVSAEKI